MRREHDEQEPWDPERAAAHAGVEVRTDAVADLLGGALAACWRGTPIVVLSPALTPAERRVALAHELVHLERGGGVDPPAAPSGWAAVAAREEQLVDDEVARRLVPPGVLEAAQRAGAVTDVAIAHELGVTAPLVRRAVRLATLSGRARGSADRRRRAR